MKKLLKVLVVMGLLVVLVVVAGFVFIDQAAKAAVERGGTYALGVETKLGSADVGLFSGRFGLDSLSIANPEGFKQQSFLSLSKGEMELELGSLREATLVVPRLLLEGVAIDLERNDLGTNFGAILDYLERFESGKKPGEPPAESEGRKVLLKEVVIRDVSVSVDLGQSVAGFQSTSFQVPEIVLTDLGTGGEGQTISEHFSSILRGLLGAVMEHGKGMIPQELLADLQGRLAELGLPADILEGGVDGALEGVKEKAAEELKKLGGDAEKKLKQLDGGMSDLLKKKDGN